MNKITPKNALMLGLLLLLGVLGNYFTLPLFFGADFLFGSVFVLLILHLFGLRCSLIAALIVNSYTYVLWGHPYGFIIFTLEILFVGLFLRDKRRNLLLLDGLYWLLIGVPLNALIYYVILHMDITTTAFIILKQSVNGIFNALLVCLAINYIPWHRFPGRLRERRTVSIRETTFNLLVALVLIPALILTIIQIRGEMKRIENSAVVELQMLSSDIQSHLVSWHQQHLNPIMEIAQFATKTGISSPEKLTQDMEILNRSFPGFRAMHVENSAGITIACYPTENERGTTIGVSLADREWFKEVKAGLKPVLSGVFLGDRLTMSPTAILSVPILKGEQFLGTATAALELQRINRFLEPYSRGKYVTITLTDSSNRVIASTAPDRVPMQKWDRKKNGIVSPIIATIYRWSPDEKNLPSMTRWRKSCFVQEVRIAPYIPWTLIIESPIAPLQKRLYGIYVQDLSILAVLVVLTLLMAFALSRWLAKPLANLASLTSSLPEKITMQQMIEWPMSETKEVESLIGNFQSMTQALEHSFQNIKDHANALNMTLNATADGILAVGSSGKIIFYNQQFATLWEIPQKILDTGDDKMLLDRVLDQVSDPDAFMKGVQRLYESDENSFDVICFKDGGTFERYSFPLQQGDSAANGRVWSFRNITERKQQESVLRKSEYEFRMLAEAMPQIVWVCSPDGMNIYFNQRWVDYTGLSLEESAGHGWNKPFHPDDHQRVWDGWQFALRSGRNFTSECRLCRADGVYKWWLIRGVPVLDEAESIIKWFGTCTDIDELKKAEEEKLSLEQQLQQTQKLESLGVLAGGIAHDFNNLLATIIGNCFLARLNPENFTENLAIIEKASESAAALCRQMLDYAGHTQASKSQININLLVNDMVEMLASTGCKNVMIKPVITQQILFVYGDASQIRQVVMNLMINATEAIGEVQGEIDFLLIKITITAGQPEKDHLGRIIPDGVYACLEATDNGCGMDEETKRRLFEPFFTTKFTGRGLGLSATLGIITGHGGFLQLFSQPGKGTTFKVYLPASCVDEGGEELRQHQSIPAQWKGSGTILLAEDDDQVRLIAKTILAKNGFTVVEAVNGSDALEKYQKNSAAINLVITDIGMPIMDGYDLFFELKKINPELPIIISSGFGDKIIFSRIPKEDTAGLIGKPYKPVQLIELLKNVLESQ
jgi:PAS domain S-box-containing protein